MNVLLVNQYYPPDTSATAVILKETADALLKVSNVTIIAGRPSYNPTTKHGIYLSRSECSGQLRIERVGSTSYDRAFLIGRILNYLTYLLLTLLKGLAVNPKPDVIISMTDPPIAAFVGAFISIVRRSTFIYVIQDFHPDLAQAMGIPIPNLLNRIWNFLNIKLLQYSKSVIVLGEDMKDRLVRSKGINPNKIHVVRSGSTEFPISKTDGTKIIKSIRGDYDFVALHAGNLGYVGNFKLIIDAFHNLTDHSIGLVFVGQGVLKTNLIKYAKDMDNIKFLNFYPKDELRHVYSAADLHIVSIKSGLEGLVLPSKLYSVLKAGKPLLANAPIESDVSKIINEYGCGITNDTDDASTISNAILELKGDSRSI